MFEAMRSRDVVRTTTSCELLADGSMLADDELDNGCLMIARVLVTDRASRANLLNAADEQIVIKSSSLMFRLVLVIFCYTGQRSVGSSLFTNVISSYQWPVM